MRVPATIAVALVMACIAASPAAANTVCTWGGTPADPTGTFTIDPGITNIPAPAPLDFMATGPLAGDPGCTGTLTYVGRITASSTCLLANFEGTVKGLSPARRFWAKGNILAPALLYDRNGNVVGHEHPQLVTPNNVPHYTDCSSPEGFTGGWPGNFSSIVQLF